MGLVQYLKDTRGELNHVAWPTRVQTIIFTTLVIIISILVSLYLGFFDYLFTTGLGKAVGTLPVDQAPALDVSELITTESIGTTTNQ
jgi:preprotein translocase SecE subunit